MCSEKKSMNKEGRQCAHCNNGSLQRLISPQHYLPLSNFACFVLRLLLTLGQTLCSKQQAICLEMLNNNFSSLISLAAAAVVAGRERGMDE
jgi:hypothetical protein